jgi:hypothetical protein
MDDLLAEEQDVVESAPAAARQANVSPVDPEVLHEMQEGELFANGRVFDRRVLETITKSLVEESGVLRQKTPFALNFVPIEDEL